MKNNYNLDLLMKRELSSRNDENSVFFRMLKIIAKADNFSLINSLDALSELLPAGDFYVAHNLTCWKGKQLFLKGRVYYAERKHLIFFLQESSRLGDLRNLLISPFFSDTPQHVICVNEDQYYFYQSRC